MILHKDLTINNYMRKLILVTALITLTFLSYSQVFDKGNIAFNLGIGIDLFSTDITPAGHFSGEIGVIPISNVGVISFGGNVDANIVDFDNVHTHLAFRTAFHFNFIKTERFDIYAGVGSGLRLYDHNANSALYFDEFIGARMLLTQRFGLFLEAGYGATAAKFGICWVL